MIDQVARNEVRQVVDDFFYDRIKAFEFDNRLLSIKREDKTVGYVVDSLWCIYDDCKDHYVNLDKPAWDTVQRLLLLLESEGEIAIDVRRRWHVSQVLAVLMLATIGAAYWLNYVWWIAPVGLGGIVSIVISQWRQRILYWESIPDPFHCWPFSSIDAVHSALVRAPTFRKVRYRPQIASRRIRSKVSSGAVWFQFYMLWMIGSPIALLGQSFPRRISQVHVHQASGSGRS